MRFTEEFKKQVVKKVLSPGVVQVDIARKLKISVTAISDWKKLYAEEVKAEIVQINLDAILQEEKIDIEKMLLDAEPEERKWEIGILDKIEKGRPPAQYTPTEKYAIIVHLKKISGEQAGIFMRSYGLHSQHIKMWEDEILAMGKKQIDQNEIIKRQEEEIKLLRKKLKESERDKRELEILIELKKSTRLFSSRTGKNDSSGSEGRNPCSDGRSEAFRMSAELLEQTIGHFIAHHRELEKARDDGQAERSAQESREQAERRRTSGCRKYCVFRAFS